MKTMQGITTRAILAATFAYILVAPVQAQEYQEGPFCQILDRTTDPIWTLHLGYTERADVKATGGDDFGLFDIAAESGLLYLRTDYGDFDIGANFAMRVVLGDGGIDMPDQFGQLNADIAWINRYYDGWASLIQVSPGLYTDYEDISGEDFFMPFEVSLIRAFNDQASGQFGLRIFPDFDRSVDPIIGIRWELSPDILLDLFYPDSRILFAVTRDLEAYAGFSIREYPEYQLQKDDARDRFMFRESRAFVGINNAISDSTRVMIELGAAIDREVEFDGPGGDADVDDALFIRIGLGGTI